MYRVDTHTRDGRTDVILFLSDGYQHAEKRLSPDSADALATRLTNAARKARLADEAPNA